jgi:hypothetical protein
MMGGVTPMRRALETAEGIASVTGLTVRWDAQCVSA